MRFRYLRRSSATPPSVVPISVASVILLLVCGCIGKPELTPESIGEIVAELKSDDLGVREAAVEKLDDLTNEGLTGAEARALLREAAQPFPPLEDEWRDAGSELVRAAASDPHKDHASIIQSHFSSYSIPAKHDALGLLALLPDRAAMNAYAELAIESADELEYLPTGSIASEPRHCALIVPPLSSLVQRQTLRWGVCEISLACLQNDALDEDAISQVADAVVPVADEYRRSLMPLQGTDGIGWMWEEEYQEGRSTAALVLDVLGCSGDSDALDELALALEYSDPWLRMFAVVGSLRNGLSVSPAAIEEVAASAEARNWFFRHLVEIGREDVFPSRYATQEAFAESDMVNWLTYPTELARVPDEIELMKVFSQASDQGPEDYYLFRFRTFPPHWAADDGWMAGVSGPFLRKDAPSPDSYGGTFSSFDDWESMTPEEHLEEITGLLLEARELWESE